MILGVTGYVTDNNSNDNVLGVTGYVTDNNSNDTGCNRLCDR